MRYGGAASILTGLRMKGQQSPQGVATIKQCYIRKGGRGDYTKIIMEKKYELGLKILSSTGNGSFHFSILAVRRLYSP